MRVLLIILSLLPFKAFAEPSLDDKIAQMIMVGFNGQELKQNSPIYKDIKDNNIGGIILFNENADANQPHLQKNIKEPKQLKKLISDLQKISKKPLFVSIDQEGGKVSRFNNNFNVSRYSAQNLGTINSPSLTYKEALKTAKVLKEMGININFAPTVDVKINPDSPIAKKERIYSANQDTVTAHALEVIKANKEQGILPVLKHFPGHGSANADTHDGFVDVTKTFKKKELKPYKDIIKIQPNIGVMTTHVFNDKIDNIFPLSLSKKSITGLLKTKIGFNGLVFSDDLNMGALAKQYNWQDVLTNAINAGTDVLVIGNNLSYNPNVAKDSIAIIKQAVIDGRISEQRINDSYNKIINYKKGL